MWVQLKFLASAAVFFSLWHPLTAPAETASFIVTLEVLEYDCANRPQQLAACNSALKGASLSSPDLAKLDAAAGAESVASYGTAVEPWSSHAGIFCGENRSFTVDFETGEPEDSHYLIELAYEYTDEDKDIMAGSTSVKVLPGEAPSIVGGALTTLDTEIEGRTQTVSSLRLVLLSTEVL